MRTETQPHTGVPWRLDRRVSVSVCLSALGSLGAAVFLAAGLAVRVEHLEARARAQDAEAGQARSVVVGVARLEERLEAVHRSLENLRADVRGIERRQGGGGGHVQP